jgi:hypothetical protein
MYEHIDSIVNEMSDAEVPAVISLLMSLDTKPQVVCGYTGSFEELMVGQPAPGFVLNTRARLGYKPDSTSKMLN